LRDLKEAKKERLNKEIRKIPFKIIVLLKKLLYNTEKIIKINE